MDLTTEELRAKEFMIEKFLPALHNLLNERNPLEYLRWNGNCCRQTAIFGARYLEMLLPDYDFTVWDGMFRDFLFGRKVTYNHAWIFGVNKKNRSRKLFIDLARIHQDILFFVASKNAYPTHLYGYQDLECTHRTQLNWKEMIEKEAEYYTKYSGSEFIFELDRRIK